MFNLKMEQAGGLNGNAAGGGGGQNGGGAAGSSGASQAQNIAAGGGNPNGAGAGGLPVGGGSGGSGDGGTNGKSWLEALPDDIRSDPSLQMFKDTTSLAKSWVHAQKNMYADKVVIPNEKSTEEEWNAFHQKLGRPESADKYELKAPQGQQLDEGVAKGFKELAFKTGLSAKQVSSIAEWNFQVLAQQQEAQQAAQINALRDTLSAYKQNLGGEEKYLARVDDARLALNAVGSPELKKFLETSGLGSRPEMVEFFANLKPMMDEGKIRDGSGASLSEVDVTVLQKELDDLQEKMYANINSPEVNQWSERSVKLRERINAARTRSA